MSIDVIQSQHPEILLDELINTLIQPTRSPQQLFQPKYFIVPSYGTGQWLQQKIADQIGISANLKFDALRTFQWELYQQVLGYEVVAKAPQMLNMKWRIYLFLSQFIEQSLTEQHPLFSIMQRIHQHTDFIPEVIARQSKQQGMLYWVADQTSRLFANYIIYRGQCVQGCVGTCKCRQNWLGFWGRDQALNIQDWIQKPEKEVLEAQPDVLHYAIEQAQTLESWQRYIWVQEFAKDYADMQNIDLQFWQKLEHEDAEHVRRKLPQHIYVFTVLELPPSQLLFLRRLAQYISVKVFHYTPSQEYWADSVDPKWKAKYALKYPDAAVYYESRHPLLTRLGKQARDISGLLTQLAGGEEGQWDDLFPEHQPQTLLAQLQSDILHLREPIANSYPLAATDQSIQIHVCHSTLRQLEALKDQLLHWLNQRIENSQKTRHASDILVLVPNLQDVEPLIRTVFSANFESGQVNLPIKIAGVPQLDSLQLWQSLTLRIRLLQQRFSLEQLIDWLSLTATQQLYQLNFEQIQRMQELLQLAGFKRGFDAQHLAQSLSDQDQDFRFTFRYALDRLSLAIAMPVHAVFAEVLSLTDVRHSDFALVTKLIDIYQDLQHRRDWLMPQVIEQQQDISQWLEVLRQDIDEFAECTGLQQVIDALYKLKRIIEVTHAKQVQLPLQFILDEIANTLEHQVAQTEPTGQITFAQIGQLRPLPYRLVVCLNLDTGTFPNRDSHIPFDLMELLRAELGDRSRLEDDQGSFLDAMLLAQDEFWMFYNGYDVNDAEIRDPSSIVQELISHLQTIIKQDKKQSDLLQQDSVQRDLVQQDLVQQDLVQQDLVQQDLVQQDLVQQDAQPAEKVLLNGIEVPSQLVQLYHTHTLQPFDPQDFIHRQPPRFIDQWFHVAEQIEQPQQQTFYWLNQEGLALQSAMYQSANQQSAYPQSTTEQQHSIWQDAEQAFATPLNTDHLSNLPSETAPSEQTQVIDAQQWIKDLCFPAQHFLTHVGVKNVTGIEAYESFEPLTLNGLQKYGVRDYLQQTLFKSEPAQRQASAQIEKIQQQTPQQAQLLQDRLPVGKMQSATLQQALGEHELLLQRLQQHGGLVTAITQQRWQYDTQTQFMIFVPEQDTATQWVSVTASSCRDERPLKVWLEYLFWRAQVSTEVELQRIALFNNVTLIVGGLSQAQAKEYLQHWLEAWHHAQQQPFVLPPALFANIGTDQPKWQLDAEGRMYCENYSKLESRWLGQKFYPKGFNAAMDKGCHRYTDWALLLQQHDVKRLLNQFTERYAAQLYHPLSMYVQTVEGA